jgi:hypothetical protein
MNLSEDLTLIRRTMTPDFVLEVVNHPEVRPWLGSPGMDLAPGIRVLVSNPLNHVLVSGGAAVIFQWIEPGRYEVHSQCLPEWRGEHSQHVAQEVMRYMFTRTDCREVVTRVPEGNLGAVGVCRTVGFVKTFERPDAWPSPEGVLVPVQFYSLTEEKWRGRDPAIPSIGKAFHDWLEGMKAEAGSDRPVHPEDEDHDRAVGASALMASSGQGAKAVLSYNRWASLAGYEQISLVSDAPLVLDLVDAVVQINGREAFALLVR